MAGLANKLARQVLAFMAYSRLHGDWLHAAFRDFHANIVTAIWQTTSRPKRTGGKLAILNARSRLPAHTTNFTLYDNAYLGLVRQIALAFHH